MPMERSRAAADLRLMDIIEFLPDAAFVIDQDKRVIAWNKACETLTGVPKADMLGRGNHAYAEPFYGDRRPILIDLLDAPSSLIESQYKYVERRGEAVFCETFIPRLRGGGGAHLWASAAALYDREGRRSGAIEVVRDVTAQKLAELALRESERKYRELVENANSIILRWTPDARITFLNEFGQRFFGYTLDEIRGRHVMETIVPRVESAGRDLGTLMDEICRDPASFEQNLNENMRRNGERVWIAWTNKIVTDAEGRVTEIFSIGQDVTARKQAEEELHSIRADLERRVAARTAELAAAKERAEAADRLKSTFLAAMSHELRTPLNSVIGFAGLLLQRLAGPLNEEQTKQLRMIKDSGQHLLALINEVLDISKIEAGQIEFHIEPFDLPSAIRDVIQTLRPLAERKGLRIEARISPEVGSIRSDRRRVGQVLLNLVGNSIKFTDAGGVEIECLQASDKAIVRVTDTGIGIKPEDLGDLFRPFHQVDTGLTRQYEGTGLGLAISKRLVERLGGAISAESVWGRGSTFQFTLPLDAAGDQ